MDSTPKKCKCCHVLILKLFQICPVSTKPLTVAIDFDLVIFFPWKSMATVKRLIDNPYSSKYLLLCSTEEINSYMDGTT